MFKRFKKIKMPAAHEIQSIIRFLNARNMKLADIHCQLCEVYGEHAMSDSMLRRWVRYFNEGTENVHDDPRSSQPSVVNEDLVRKLFNIFQFFDFLKSFLRCVCGRALSC
jgi:hypothetical protein